MTEQGHLFHIDFGHFLGNFKTKKLMVDSLFAPHSSRRYLIYSGTLQGGLIKIERERAAFVLLPEHAYVMGGSSSYEKQTEFQLFKTLASQCYAVLRENAQILESMFLLMTSAGV